MNKSEMILVFSIGLCKVITGRLLLNATEEATSLPSPASMSHVKVTKETLPGEIVVMSVTREISMATLLCSGTHRPGFHPHCRKTSWEEGGSIFINKTECSGCSLTVLGKELAKGYDLDGWVQVTNFKVPIE